MWTARALGPAACTAMALAVVLGGCAQVLSIEEWTEATEGAGPGGQGSASVGQGGSQSSSVGTGGMGASSSGTGGQGVCGDGQITGTEGCDDGNAGAGDGCDASCAIEPGYECMGEPSICCAPEPEICDGLDNNCNGIIDENNPGGGAVCMTTFPGVCAAGTKQCKEGLLKCISNVMPSMETCNGLDDNCDGQADDNDPGGGMACMTGQPGICSAGTTACQSGSLFCQQTNFPSTEICNGLDDDCNAKDDEGDPGGGMACTVTGQQGVCAAGVSTCMDGALVCAQTVQPSAEICDTKDNDCDGQTDDGNPGGGAACQTFLQGVCTAGTMTCTNGAVICVQNVQASNEICDGKDNDCDGLIDEGFNNVTVFSESFADNTAGWSFDTEWAIGPAAAGPTPPVGKPDPATDHTLSADNGVGGVVIGGNYAIAAHPYYYLTSPIIDTNAAGSVVLDFWRWLNTDYPPYVTNRIEAYNGSAWIVIWEQPPMMSIVDPVWTNINFDLTAHKNAGMRVRFGFTIGASAFISSGWNVDDVVIRRCQ